MSELQKKAKPPMEGIDYRAAGPWRRARRIYWNMKRRMLMFISRPTAAMVVSREVPP